MNKSPYLNLTYHSSHLTGISLIEWGNRLALQPQLMPPNTHRLDATISTIAEEETRYTILTAPTGSTWVPRLKALLDEGVVDDLLFD